MKVQTVNLDSQAEQLCKYVETLGSMSALSIKTKDE